MKRFLFTFKSIHNGNYLSSVGYHINSLLEKYGRTGFWTSYRGKITGWDSRRVFDVALLSVLSEIEEVFRSRNIKFDRTEIVEGNSLVYSAISPWTTIEGSTR